MLQVVHPCLEEAHCPFDKKAWQRVAQWRFMAGDLRVLRALGLRV